MIANKAKLRIILVILGIGDVIGRSPGRIEISTLLAYSHHQH